MSLDVVVTGIGPVFLLSEGYTTWTRISFVFRVLRFVALLMTRIAKLGKPCNIQSHFCDVAETVLTQSANRLKYMRMNPVRPGGAAHCGRKKQGGCAHGILRNKISFNVKPYLV